MKAATAAPSQARLLLLLAGLGSILSGTSQRSFQHADVCLVLLFVVVRES